MPCLSSGAAPAAAAMAACGAGRGETMGCSSAIGAGWSGRIPFTSGSGREGRASALAAGNPTRSSSGTIPIS